MGVALMLTVGGTRMVVDMDDHYRPSFIQGVAVCRHCGVLTPDFEVHLAYHLFRGEVSIISSGEPAAGNPDSGVQTQGTIHPQEGSTP
jgi:hypothetical protein